MTDAPIITLTTDFGVSSPYVAEIKGTILGLCRRAIIVDISHAVPPQQIAPGAWTLRQAVPAFPPGTCHIGVIDPGVGTARDLMWFALESIPQTLLVPDNGLAGPLLAAFGVRSARRLTNAQLWRTPLSATFHGRDILAPVAAHLANELSPSQLGPETEDWCPGVWPQPTEHDATWAGVILFIDDFGNLITNITRQHLNLSQPSSPVEPALEVQLGPATIGTFVRTYGCAAPGTVVTLFGSSGFLEVAVVQGNAAARLGARIGDRVTLRIGPAPRT